MVGFDKQHEKLTQFDFAFAGGASGCITRATCQPLDVLKIRFQLQVEPISHKAVSKYRSIFQAVYLISREEGIKAFWKGHIPAQWLSIIYGIVQFWTFEVLSKKAYQLNLPAHTSPIVNFVCGSAAGCTATVVSFPFDVIRTRLVAQSEQKKVYEGILHAGQNICRNEGPMVLFRGLWPTVIQIGPHAGAQFMCYKIFDDLYKTFVHSTHTTLSSSLVAGSLAGLCAKTFIYPFDLAKKRLQIQGFEEGRAVFGGVHFQCKGLTDCLVRIYKVEGVPGFFKGLAPSLIKAVFTTALHFSSYEMICNLLLYARTNF
ncbi:mitochondrial thiamine pyrophosphate carrier [Anoplophora glabripennis]|uniref:mitochondrial thiamine pyrophosphate carrier n=1 Tax=Anoplophora glabripennis TaxID=217634 RepID=UPI0008743ECF|nr:mitochondrial thiamine pyrophosphate carrier [Anoplophora glabripennis]XP_018574331.1 mitochondrial thiamine pyrophosphate carrier [Anoplophora glabripennis]